MDARKLSRVALPGLFVVTILLSLVPVLQTLQKGEYRGIPPAYVDDDLYYYARMREVADGKLFIGNPYFFEYRDAGAASFFVTDWIASIPLLVGLPFSVAILLNLVWWSLVFVYLAYLVGRSFALSSPASAAVAFISYIEVYWVIFRPVVMQQVFPFFLLFLLAFIVWLRHPLQRWSMWILAATCAAAFYVYLFLWQILFVTLGIVLAHMCVQRKWKEVKSLLTVALGTGILALPVLAYTVYQIRMPLYWETAHRVGLVLTHLPTMDAYLYGRWAILVVALSLCLRAWLKTDGATSQDGYDIVSLSAVYSGLGLLVMTVSNVVTGQDIATASHIGRFITLWVALYIPVLCWQLYARRVEALKLHWMKLTVVGMMLLACLGFLVANLKRALPFQRIAGVDTVGIQAYAEPLAWIEQNEQQPVVVWVDDDMSMYVPILTKHYVFWARPGGLHLMSTGEVEDRFLASRITALTTQELFATYEWFEGAGVFAQYLDAKNEKELLCFIGIECKTEKSLREWIGDDKLNTLLLRQRELKKNIGAVMRQYQVAYIVADTTKQEDVYFRTVPGAKEVWKNNRFIIYAIR